MPDVAFVLLTVALFAVLALDRAGGGEAVSAANLVGLILAVGADGLPGRRPAVPGAVLMSTTTAGVIFIVSLVVALALAYRPFGDYMYRVVIGHQAHLGSSGSIYRLIGVNPDGEQSWGVYARSVLAFSAVSILFLYAFQRLQSHLLLSLGFPASTPAGVLEHRRQLRHQHQLAVVLR